MKEIQACEKAQQPHQAEDWNTTLTTRIEGDAQCFCKDCHKQDQLIWQNQQDIEQKETIIHCKQYINRQKCIKHTIDKDRPKRSGEACQECHYKKKQYLHKKQLTKQTSAEIE